MFGSSAIRCDAARADLVAWIDGALPRPRIDRIARHVDGCAACATEASALRTVVRTQGAALRQGANATAVDLDAMWRRVRARVAEVETVSTWSTIDLWRTWRPALMTVMATVLLLVGGVTAVGGPETVLISFNLKAPPPQLDSKSDLFKDYPIIQQLDVLERFDTADTDPAADGLTPVAEEG